MVFVHGLLSDPSTWIRLANELESNPEFHQRYQLLAFQYPTGKAFLESAMHFRHELAALFDELWEQTRDPAILHTVLIGHSMGGLVSPRRRSG